MKRSVIGSVFEHLADNALLLVIPCALLLYFPSYHLTVLVLGASFYFVSVKDASIIPAVCILFLFLLPLPQTDPSIKEGYVREVKENYVIAEYHHSRIIVYTKEMPVYDSLIRFEGEPEPIRETNGFFRFPFAQYSRLKGITCTVSPDSVVELRASHSLRGFLMKRIRTFDPETSACLMQVLFRVSSSDDAFSGLFHDRGISLAGVFALFDILLNYLCYESDRKRFRFILAVVLGLFYHWPFLLALRVLRGILSAAGINGKTQSGIAFLISLRLFPYAVYSASFLIPLIFTLAENGRTNTVRSFFFGMHATSVLFHTVNPLELLLFRRLLPLSGFCWICGLIEALVKIPLHGLILWIDRMYAFILLFALPGSMIGAGLPFYLLLQWSVHKNRYRTYLAAGIFLVFQGFGLFHPFAEVSFINVGQGDSILVRSPLRTGDVLIDTGKPSQKNNVYTFLNAKGIRQLDTLVITHADNDHAGNQEAVTEDYRPAQVITEHQESFTAGRIRFLDLNELSNEDENESSIVTAFRLNGLEILLMGDSSAKTEAQIIRKYPDLSCNILKLSHHGSNTGSSERFLDTVRPDLAVVSSGSYSIYHHPSPDVVERLYNRRIPYLDTKEEGDITVLCIPGVNLLLTASGKIAIIRV